MAEIGAVAAGADRGSHLLNGEIYRVVGNNLYRANSMGVHTTLSVGGVTGTTRCTFADDGQNLLITSGTGSVYIYDGSTLSAVTNANISGSTAVTFLNNQFIYTNNGLFVVSDPGDGTSASGTNAAGAEIKPDSLVRAYAFDQVLYLFGAETVERWYNTGSGSPPFARFNQQLTEVGCLAAYSIANTPNAVYWLASDYTVYQERGGVAKRVSNSAMSRIFRSYPETSGAYGWTFSLGGRNFYALTFNGAGRTWCLSEDLSTKGWFELSGAVAQSIWPCAETHLVGNKLLTTGVSDGKLYELSDQYYTLGAEPLYRQRVTAPLSGISLKKPGKRLQVNKLELLMEKGVGLINGQGEDPRILCEYSLDGGKSWSSGTWMRIGRLGETQIRARMHLTKSFQEIVFRFSISDGVPITVYGGAIEVKVLGSY